MEDAAAYLALQKRLDKETSFMLLEPGERTAGVEETAKRIQSAVEQKNRTILVAEVAGRLVGWMELIGGGVRRNRHSAYIVVGIRQTYTGQGIGTRLFTAGENWARQNGIHRLELTVMVHNRAALALYPKRGFQVEGIRRDSLLVDGRYVDEYGMSKLIGDAQEGKSCVDV
ncbi:RimJ/RimL family protein N-acetyltransferase [Desmospora profundinema]|uniref:RimJ/RimL family protein N-acetyltransferase n=1 Tax=Desmospora profundinema TaxID=1571184 RepID=A0ABU1IJN2_9BACL|nr:RimJ/RimL family protein N-acetyltransferase [Desmospora profundinema]